MHARLVVGVAACLAALLIVVWSPALPSTADEPSFCEILPADALGSLGQHCMNLPGGHLCYGFGQVGVTYSRSDTTPRFDQPGDLLSLDDVQAVTTRGFALDPESWGLSTVKVFANVPLTQSGVRYILLGDVDVENRVPFEEAFEPVAGMSVTPLVPANLRAHPSVDALVIDSVTPGEELLVDGISEDGGWLRVLWSDQLLWVSYQVVAAGAGADLDALPVIRTGQQSLMQSICLRTSTEAASSCGTIPPSMLLVQAPGKIVIAITVNGVEIRGNATFVLRTLPDHIMQLYVLSGTAYTGGVSAPEGYTMTIPLSADGCGVEGLWSNLRPISAGERTMLQTLEAVPAELLDHVVHVPTEAEVAAIQQALSGSSGSRSCGGLRPTSPLGGMAYGPTIFYWDGIAGATNYGVTIVDSHGVTTGPYYTGSGNTNLTLDTSTFGGGPEFTWHVQALDGDRVLCDSEAVTVVRGGAPAQNIPVAGQSAPNSTPAPGAPTNTPGPVPTNTPGPVPTGTPGPLPTPTPV